MPLAHAFDSSLSCGRCHTRRVANRDNSYPCSWSHADVETQGHCEKATLGGSLGFGFRYMFG